MVDLSKLSDADLLAYRTSDLSKMSDEGLKVLRAPAAPAPPPDKYQQAAIDEQATLKAKGIDPGAGFTRRLAHGATLGADSTILAGLETPLEMVKRGTFDPREGYSYAKAREDRVMDDARTNTGAAGTAAEILGGGVAGGGLANAGVTASRFIAPEAGLIPRAIASAADGLGFGAVSGAMEGNGLEERAANAGKGAGFGALLGGAAPFGFAGLKAVAAPVIANIKARINPEGYAQGQVARAIQESGRAPNQISMDTIQAANEGQGGYTVADAMGNPGQRMLSTVARAPGEGRTAVVGALDARQADQGRRVAGTLAEGFESPQTAAQTRDTMTRARGATADAEYGAVRTDAEPVDVSGVINRINEHVTPYGVPHDVAAPDSIMGQLTRFRRMLSSGETNLDGSAAGGLNDFNAAQRVRQEMADAVETARRGGQGNRARILGQVLRELDTSLEAASPGFRQANANFSQASRNIDAIDQGRTAALRGRTEDTVPAYQGLTPEGQGAFRTGYADPLIEQAQGGAFGVNKARPLTSDAFRDEAAAIAPQNEMMQRRLGREMTMFETRAQATGGSKTADNLNDHAAMGVDPAFIGQILTGNLGGAVRMAMRAGSDALTGNTPQVRQAVADILLQRGGNMNPATLENMVNQVIGRMQRVQTIVGTLGRGARAGATAAVAEKLAH